MAGPSLVYGVNNVLSEQKLRLVLSPVHGTPGDLNKEDGSPDILREMSIDGLLINLMQDVPPVFLKRIEAFGTPTVWINAKLEQNCVYPNDQAATQQLVKALLARGHRRIAYICLSQAESKHYSGADRLAGYIQAMQAAGLCKQIIQLSKKDGTQSVFDPVYKPTDPTLRPTAIICSESYIANHLLYAAALRGIEVPKSLSIVSMINDHYEILGVKLSGARVPFRAIGEAAARMLIDLAEDPDKQPIAPKTIPCKFIEGQTLGVCPQPS